VKFFVSCAHYYEDGLVTLLVLCGSPQYLTQQITAKDSFTFSFCNSDAFSRLI